MSFVTLDLDVFSAVLTVFFYFVLILLVVYKVEIIFLLVKGPEYLKSYS